ncbi:DegT/DnrJ/EryC1/StrS family aminotransferase [Actinosynnema pretiosum subsp. pretiosum]|uniref:DegT/DnrJ/EryC1/StrS aminotransferase n=2 Tax=Actinosynnema TaxID=40566 RepID=C6WCR8_ACTMD|nr:DegT/DnrJ/EryC1/StrS family aminotransferase [Actinosynnema mirum]ACU35685.1 DegT/DnrJ/EryC1/StrS aminotransferase [Actinosynnema mirum DSM 43827]AXX29112.1 DegT/DnrJ/EryC1/StrS aminotransferase [Actinosynnema pretiosum subsp. pretiosum]QUF06613.1 DegT/DnrJ/EryC1/StrS family aminotransferase [Actinosynnema pretiosum subsp. pretiosum]
MIDIPLVDLRAQHAQVADEVAEGWAAVLERTAFIGGPQVAAFESEFADYQGVAHCVGVANGTDAIELALRALGVGHGDECVLPANTFIATAEAVARAGATPVLVDCVAGTGLIDPEKIPAALTDRTRAVLPVHLYGQAAPVELVRAAAPGVPVVEDAAQAQGASRFGVPVGGLGEIAATSFYPGKNLGAYGDGGAVLTSSAELAEAVRLLREHGSPRKYEHPALGFNSRLDTLQAVVLSAKLRRLEGWNEARRAAAARYAELLADLPDVLAPEVLEGNTPVWHLYVVRVPNRDRVLAALHEAGVGAGIHYPTPVHLTGAFASLGHGAGDFPVSESVAAGILSLPLFPEITEEQQHRVVAALKAAL